MVVPKPFNLISELAAFGEMRQISLRDPDLSSAFEDHVRQGVQNALGDPILLHGQRTEAMFEALVVALDGVELLKSEDGGHVYPAERYRVPDYRIVLNDGEQWLVEVKNVHIDNPLGQRRRLMWRAYHEAMKAYAEATGARLMLAVYWSRWSMWTIFPPEHFADAAGNIVVDMMAAIRLNEFGQLGDRTIGTRAPLKLRMLMDPARTSSIDPDGNVLIAVERTQLLCGDDLIEEEEERKIAAILMEFGDWKCDGPLALLDGDRLEALDFVWEPEEETEGQGFNLIGTLSRMFSRYYAGRTLDRGEIKQLRAPLRPAWFAPLATGAIAQRALPLWRFEMLPSKARTAA